MKGVAACKRARVEEGLPGTPPSEELDLEDADPNDLVGRFVDITGAPSSQAEDLLRSQEWDLERALRVYIRDQTFPQITQEADPEFQEYRSAQLASSQTNLIVMTNRSS